MDINKQQILKESLEIQNEYKNFQINHSDISFEKLKESVINKYPYITSKLPSILDLALSDNYDYKRLSYILDMNEKVKNKEITEREGSIQVGQVLVDEIVKPSIKK
tara:strand:- start:4691 stop:5008 length:318 start_codon:yes stop_codon:yes gene_type:complete